MKTRCYLYKSKNSLFTLTLNTFINSILTRFSGHFLLSAFIATLLRKLNVIWALHIENAATKTCNYNSKDHEDSRKCVNYISLNIFSLFFILWCWSSRCYWLDNYVFILFFLLFCVVKSDEAAANITLEWVLNTLSPLVGETCAPLLGTPIIVVDGATPWRCIAADNSEWRTKWIKMTDDTASVCSVRRYCVCYVHCSLDVLVSSPSRYGTGSIEVDFPVFN